VNTNPSGRFGYRWTCSLRSKGRLTAESLRARSTRRWFKLFKTFKSFKTIKISKSDTTLRLFVNTNLLACENFKRSEVFSHSKPWVPFEG